jgi:hypothetical protein
MGVLMQEQLVPSNCNTPFAYMERRASVPTARYRSRPFPRYWAMARPFASVLSPGGCITANADLQVIRNLTSNQCSTQPSLHRRHLSCHRLDSQGCPTCHARNPARPKNGGFLGCQHSVVSCISLQYHLHTLISIVQTRCRNWGYIYETNAPRLMQSIGDKQQHFGFDVDVQLKPVWSKRPTIKSVLGLPNTHTSFPQPPSAALSASLLVPSLRPQHAHRRLLLNPHCRFRPPSHNHWMI